MGYEIVGKVIGDFLTRPEPEVLSLKGVWGAGKTYAWKKIFNDFPKEECHLPSYSYVSLFGISSLQDLKLAIVMNAITIKDDKEIHKFIEKSYKKGAKLIDIVKGAIPIIKDISFSAESFLPNLIKDIIVCFDDFERLTMDGSIQPEEVLGFISELKEEKNCKVILIFNEEKLVKNLKNIYDKYREKVIDIEIQFSPTVEEAVKIVFSDDSPYFQHMVKYCSNLGITNVRIIQKIYKYIKLMEGFDCNLNSDVMSYLIQDLILVVACHYKIHEELPDIDFLRNNSREDVDAKLLAGIIERMGGGEVEKPKNEDEIKVEQWVDFIRVNKSSYPEKKFFVLIIDSVIKGYFDEEAFKQQVNKLQQWLTEARLRKIYQSAVNNYYSFKINEIQFIDNSQEAFNKSISVLEISDLKILDEMYSVLGKEDLANELIDFFCKNKISLENAEDYKENLVYGHTGNKVIDKIKEYINELLCKTDWSLEDALNNFFDNYSDEALRVLESATEEDFYKLITTKGLRSTLTHNVIKCLALKKHNTIVSKVKNALEKIAAESDYNRVRISYLFDLVFNDNGRIAG